MQNFKSLLLASGASVAAFAGASGQAAEWDVRVGGYYNAMVAYASVDEPATISGSDFDGVNTSSNGEVFFLPSITLDNGIRIGANIQLEGESTGGDQIDEAFVYIQGSFGRILIGEHNSAGLSLAEGGPNASIFLNDHRTENFDPRPYDAYLEFAPFNGGYSDGTNFVSLGSDIYSGTLGTTYIENDRRDDVKRVTYFTPRFAGFQLGVSYAPDASGFNNGPANCDTGLCHLFDIGANYASSFGDIATAISVRWGTADASNASTDNPTIFGAGVNLGYAGFTIGGSFAEQNNTPTSDGTAYEVGIGYELDKWNYTANYFSGNNVDNEHAFAALSSGDPEETLTALTLAAEYDLHENVNVTLFGAYVDFDEDLGDGGVGTPGDSTSSFIIGTGLSLSF